VSPLLLGLISVLLAVLGQSILKHGLSFIDLQFEMFINLKGWLTILQRGWIPAGVICYAIGMIFWLQALNRSDLSRLYPLTSLNYVILTLIGFIFFHEKIGWLNIKGLPFILIGICFIFHS